MADGYLTATLAGLRAALIGAPGVAALIGDRVVDEPAEGIDFPYVRVRSIEPTLDDTDGTSGAVVQVSLVAHSRPEAGRIEAARICEAMQVALHRRPDVVPIEGYSTTEIEVQTFLVERQKDGASYEGRLALELHLDA